LNLENVNTGKFVKETRQGGMNAYSIRFFDSNGNVAMRANFVKMYDDNGNLLSSKSNRYDELFIKYGKREIIEFTA
jgi:putative heme iron utilization protein